MSDAQPRWEWRTFAPAFDRIDDLLPDTCELAHDIYVLSADSDANVKMRGDRISVKTRDEIRNGLELWRPAFSAVFPLCQRDVREVLRLLSTALPSALFLPQYTALDFVTDVAGATGQLRVAGVHKMRRHTVVEDCIVERASASMAGQTVQTVSVEGHDPDAVSKLLHRLRLDQFENVSYLTYLKRLLGLGPFACAPSAPTSPERLLPFVAPAHV